MKRLFLIAASLFLGFSAFALQELFDCRLTVYTPAGYEASGAKYPVVLHGRLPYAEPECEYPDMFNWSGMFSAGINVTDPSVSPMYQDFDKKLATYFSKNPALLWIGCGKTDFLYEMNAEFRKQLDDAGYPYEYIETEEGHIWRNWRIYFTEFIPKLF